MGSGGRGRGWGWRGREAGGDVFLEFVVSFSTRPHPLEYNHNNDNNNIKKKEAGEEGEEEKEKERGGGGEKRNLNDFFLGVFLKYLSTFSLFFFYYNFPLSFSLSL